MKDFMEKNPSATRDTFDEIALLPLDSNEDKEDARCKVNAFEEGSGSWVHSEALGRRHGDLHEEAGERFQGENLQREARCRHVDHKLRRNLVDCQGRIQFLTETRRVRTHRKDG